MENNNEFHQMTTPEDWVTIGNLCNEDGVKAELKYARVHIYSTNTDYQYEEFYKIVIENGDRELSIQKDKIDKLVVVDAYGHKWQIDK